MIELYVPKVLVIQFKTCALYLNNENQPKKTCTKGGVWLIFGWRTRAHGYMT